MSQSDKKKDYDALGTKIAGVSEPTSKRIAWHPCNKPWMRYGREDLGRKHVEVGDLVTCPGCNGEGFVVATIEKVHVCTYCTGSGFVEVAAR